MLTSAVSLYLRVWHEKEIVQYLQNYKRHDVVKGIPKRPYRVQFRKRFTWSSLCGWGGGEGGKNFQKIILSSLLLFSCACYEVD